MPDKLEIESGGGVNTKPTVDTDFEKRFFAGGKIEAYCGPQEVGAPDDLEAVIIDFIDNAKEDLLIAVQELDNTEIAQAIINAAWRGVTVTVFLEQDYLRDRQDKLPKAKKPPAHEDYQRIQWDTIKDEEDNKHGINRNIFGALLRNGVNVRADYNSNIFHQKFIIRDYTTSKDKPTPSVLTGSTNFTWTGCHKNLNHVVIFHDIAIARRYKSEFDQLRRGIFGRGGETRNNTVVQTYNVGGVPVRILFAPDNTPELEMIKQMLRAKHRIDYAIFTFVKSSSVDDAMVALHRAGVKVRGAMEKRQSNREWSSRQWLQLERLEFYFPDTQDPVFKRKLGKLHHKLLVIDDHIVIGGSMNFTGPANETNDENIFVLGSPFNLPEKHGGPVNHSRCAALADFFRREVNRIIDHSVRVDRDT
ncbi:MAG: phospholipase D-like domain-containing protein [Chloroflexota bacterium]